MSRFLDPRLAALAPYTPGEQPQNRRYVKLNTNESPFPPSRKVVAAGGGCGRRGAAQPLSRPGRGRAHGRHRAALRPHGGAGARRQRLGRAAGVLLPGVLPAVVRRGLPGRSYGFYPVYAALTRTDALQVPLRPDFSIAPEDYFRLGRTIVLANPNAPTGMALTRAQVEAVVRENPDRVVVIDEAYVDFGAESAVPLIGRYDNLLVVQTFSKSRNLAGMRLGMALGDAALIQDLNTVKFSFNPYNVSRTGQLAGLAAMEDEAYFAACTGAIRQTRARTAAALASLGFSVLPSLANFVFARHPAIAGGALYAQLKARGVLVRHFDKPGIATLCASRSARTNRWTRCYRRRRRSYGRERYERIHAHAHDQRNGHRAHAPARLRRPRSKSTRAAAFSTTCSRSLRATGASASRSRAAAIWTWTRTTRWRTWGWRSAGAARRAGRLPRHNALRAHGAADGRGARRGRAGRERPGVPRVRPQLPRAARGHVRHGAGRGIPARVFPRRGGSRCTCGSWPGATRTTSSRRRSRASGGRSGSRRAGPGICREIPSTKGVL